MKTPSISSTLSSSPASPSESRDVTRSTKATPIENAQAERHAVSIGDGEQREKLMAESEAIQAGSPTHSASCSDAVLTTRACQHNTDTSVSDERDPPEETRSELLKQLEYRVVNFTGPENHQKFLAIQLELFKEFIHYMAENSNDESVPIWMYFSLSDFNKLISEVISGNIPLSPSKPAPLLRPGRSIIEHEYRKFTSQSKQALSEMDSFESNTYTKSKDTQLFKFEKNGFTRCDLEKYYSELRSNLEIGKQSTAFVIDRLLLDDLVALENKSNPGINLYHIDDASNFASTLTKLLSNTEADEASFRFLVCTGLAPQAIQPTNPKFKARYYAQEEHVHYCAFDILKTGDRISVLGLEPTELDTIPATIMQSKIRSTLPRMIPNVKIQSIGLSVQRSDGECHIFCLSFLRKLFKHKEEIRTLHLENLENNLQILQPGKLKNIFPASFMKHAQSKNRISEYLEASKNREHEIVNKNEETLIQRHQRHITNLTTTHNEIVSSSNSIDQKRVAIIEKLVDELRLTDGLL